jgi:hypothetical protein
MAEPISEKRKILDRIWDSEEHRGDFPFGTLIVVLTAVLTIMAVFLSTQGESRTGDDMRWIFFLLLVIILCVTAVRWVYPKRAWYEGMHYTVDLDDGEFKLGLNKHSVQQAIEGNIFGQINLLLDLKETFVNKVMVRKRLSRPDLRAMIENGKAGHMIKDIDLIWIVKATTRDIEDLLMDESNGIGANFYVWFSDMLRKVEEWH